MISLAIGNIVNYNCILTDVNHKRMAKSDIHSKWMPASNY